jgi:hypothetical protein
MSPLEAAAGVLAPTVTIAIGLGLVGAAVRLLTRRWMTHLPSAAVTVGLGAATAAVVVALSFRFTGRSHVTLGVLLVTAAVVVVVGAVLDLRRSPDRRASVRAWVRQVANPTDLVALALVLLVMSSALALGPTFWTRASNDFHRYVASVQIWQSDEVGYPDFGAVHSGDFESTQVERALSEKPMSTALLLAAARLGGLAAHQALTPLLLVLLWAGTAAAMHVVSRRFGLGTPMAAALACATTLSLLPMVVVGNAQLGHALVLPLAAIAVAVGAGAAPVRHPASVAVVLGLVLAATLGANASATVGFSLVLAAAIGWLLTRGGTPWRQVASGLVGAAVVAGLLTAAFLPWFLVSLRGQSGGEAGFDSPLASPLAFVGLQVSRVASAPLEQAVVSWLLLAVVLTLAVRPSRALVRRHAGFALLVGAGVVSATALTARYGPDSYLVFKWTLTVIGVVMPFVLAAALARALRVAPDRGRGLTAGAALVGVAALVITLVSMRGVTTGARPGIAALAEDQRLAAVEVLNIDMTDYFSNSMAPLVVPSPRIVVTRPTYADPQAPVGDVYLVNRSQLAGGAYELVEELSAGYALARRDLVVVAPTTFDVGTDSADRRILVGTWTDEGDGATWARGRSSWIALDPRGELTGADLVLTLDGLRAAPGSVPRELVIGTSAGPLERVQLTADREVTATVRLPATLVDDDGRLRVNLSVDGPGARSDLTDLEYALETITVSTADGRTS